MKRCEDGGQAVDAEAGEASPFEELRARVRELSRAVRRLPGPLSAESRATADEILAALIAIFEEAEYLDLSVRACQDVVKFCDRLQIKGPATTRTMVLMHRHYEHGDGDEDDYLCY